MIVGWLAAGAAGLVVTIIASRRAVNYASALALGLGVSPFLVGVSLMAIGTDLPEMANSVVASASGHGDINLGDSIGSAVTQLTLVLGILPFAVGSFAVGRQRVLWVGLATTVVLALAGILSGDGRLSRLDAALLVGSWALATVVLLTRRHVATDPAMVVPTGRAGRLILATLVSLAFVGGGATVTVTAVIRIAESFGAPEFLVSFFGLAIGTSLPELVVDVAALRAGQRDLAIGDVFGSSLVDSTLALGLGPLLFPTAVTATYGLVAGLAAAPMILCVTLVLAVRRRHDRWSGILLLVLYASFYPVMLGLG